LAVFLPHGNERETFNAIIRFCIRKKPLNSVYFMARGGWSNEVLEDSGRYVKVGYGFNS
ncbi:14098_t:CDS:1, partial [Gigaspora rosea]